MKPAEHLIKQDSIEGMEFYNNPTLKEKVFRLEGLFCEWEYLNFYCMAVRHPDLGHWCGYVGVDPTHQFYRKGYNDPVDVSGMGRENLSLDPDNQGIFGLFIEALDKDETLRVYHLLDTHRGITYSDKFGRPFGRYGRWYFGFDCAHARDVHFLNLKGVPKATAQKLEYLYRDITKHSNYRTLVYVKKTVNRMADQLIFFTNEKSIHKTRGRRFQSPHKGGRSDSQGSDT